MSDSMTSLDQLYQSFYNEIKDSNVTKSVFIARLNLLLLRVMLTKPAEMFTPIYYIKDYEHYSLPTQGFRDPIAIYSRDGFIVVYRSPMGYRSMEPFTCFTDQSDAGYRYLKLRNGRTESLAVFMTIADSLTDDGAWTITGGSSLAVDAYTKIAGAGSLRFTINTDQCILKFTKSEVIDASTFTDYMRMRINTWLPVKPASIKVRVGNDASNYFEQTLTTQVTGEPFNASMVNEIEFAQNDSTLTGSVDKANIDYIEIEFNFSTAINNSYFRINNIKLAKPEVMDFEWYTSYTAVDTNGVIKQIITVDEDTTDETLIKDYPLYVSTILDGLIYDELKIKDPERAKMFYLRFTGEKDASGRYINGMGLISQLFPSRRAVYKRTRNLPDLNYNGISGNTFYNNSNIDN